MDFALFLLLNVVLLLRPDDHFPGLVAVRPYLVTIVLTTLAAWPKLLARLAGLADRPTAVCVLGVLAAGVWSLAYRGRPLDGLDFAGEFGKVVLFYFLTVAVVDTPERVRTFVVWLVGLAAVLAGLSAAHVNDWYKFPNLEPVLQHYTDPATGLYAPIFRMVGSGFFADPNDFCLLLSFGILCCVWLAQTGGGFWPLFLLPVPLFAYDIQQTHSRGGLLGVLAGGGAWLAARYGVKLAVPLGAVGAAGLLVAVGGRQAEVGSGQGAGRDRVMLWADGFTDLFRRPVYIPFGFGVGYYVEEHELVAHNSFVSGYVETGVVGGGLFLGAFLTAARVAHRAGTRPGASDWARQGRPFVLAVLAAYAVGAFSVSRNFVIPTYLVLGLAGAVWEAEGAPALARGAAADKLWLRDLGLTAGVGFVGLKLFTQFAGTAGL